MALAEIGAEIVARTWSVRDTPVGGEAAAGSLRYQSLFAVGATLFALTLAMNLLSIRLVRRYRQAYQ